MSTPRPRAATTATADGDAIPGTTIRIFLSSTFADFQVERDILQRRVFPELRRLCATSGFRLQPIDLRWGVSEAAGTDRQTLRICFDELERCRQLSPDFFLLIQLGDRYGSYILPPQLPAALVVRLMPHLAPEERAAVEAAYRLDENAVPPEYALLRAEGPERKEDEALRSALVRAGQAAEVAEADRLPFEGSATHREIQLGLLGEPLDGPAVSGVLCTLRTFAGEPRGAAAERFVERDTERAERVRQLATAVLDRLPPQQVLRYAVDWPGDAGPAFDEDALAVAYLGLLRPKLETVIAARTVARAAAEARGLDAVALANAAFERDRAARVEGREAELARLAAYLAGEIGAGLPLVVTGAAGSGKSTLLAEAVTRAAAAQPDAVLVVRYAGVTPGTENLDALLTDLRRAIARAYSQPEPATDADENQLVSSVAAQLATLPAPPERPLLLVVDALDQLDAHTQRTDWLPPRLAAHVRVVVSVLGDRPELSYLARQLPAEQVLTLAPLGWEAGRAMLHELLAAAPRRTLAPEQGDAVLATFAIRGLPLHLYLLAAEARRWRSFDPPRLGVAPLPEDTPELLRTILERLEAPQRNGRALVARALGDLAAARFGLAEDELLDLLARDTTVREAQRDLSPSSPAIDPGLPLPVALWARLHAEVEPLLTERTADDGVRLYTFYHQQLRAAGEARYLSGAEGAERHRALADYFASQSWLLGPKQWNWRKVQELVTQQERAGDRTAAEQALSGLADVLEQAPNLTRDDLVGSLAVIDALRDPLSDTGGYLRVAQRLYMRDLAIRMSVVDLPGQGRTFGRLGTLAHALGQPERAAWCYEQSLALLRMVGDRAGEGQTLGELGTLAADQGHLEVAAEYYEQALAILREVGDRAGEGQTLGNLGNLARDQGHLEAAAEYYERALAIKSETGEHADEGRVLGDLGTVARDQGHLEAAAEYYERALAINGEVGDHRAEGWTLYNLGTVARDQGHLEAAAEYYERALEILREVGEHRGEGDSIYNLGMLAGSQGRTEDAQNYYEQALAVYEAIGMEVAVTDVRARLAELAPAHKRPRWRPFSR